MVAVAGQEYHPQSLGQLFSTQEVAVEVTLTLVLEVRAVEERVPTQVPVLRQRWPVLPIEGVVAVEVHGGLPNDAELRVVRVL